ncbi:VOC family protein [Kribbella sp. CA-245084]|uniref:VOC family protein n=1 Tax=Kribbella sp. CA-245084 TaxID=3239940 RepID=UPI003D89C589
MELSLRIEVFASNPEASGEFYRRVLGFEELSRQESDGQLCYLWMGRGTARIGVGVDREGVDAAARWVPSGTEIVLEVDDIDAELRRVRATGWTLAAGLRAQPWGLRDFRLHDPAGYYLRLTSRQL